MVDCVNVSLKKICMNSVFFVRMESNVAGIDQQMFLTIYDLGLMSLHSMLKIILGSSSVSGTEMLWFDGH